MVLVQAKTAGTSRRQETGQNLTAFPKRKAGRLGSILLGCLLCLGATAAASDSARVTSAPPAVPSRFPQHAETFFAQTASAIVHLSAGSKHGTGVCLDSPCVHVLTNYHVVALLGERLRAETTKVRNITAATGPADAEARTIQGVQKNFAFRYNPARDLAVLTLAKPLPNPFHALSFATYRPIQHQRVAGIAYNPPHLSLAGMGFLSAQRDRIGIREGEISLLNAQVISLTDNRPAMIDGSLLLTFPSNAGNSGGAVVDGDGKAVGIICGAELVPGHPQNDVVGTLALPVTTVFRFLREKEPQLWARVFFGQETVSDAAAEELAGQLEGKAEAAPVAVVGPLAGLNLDHPPVRDESSDAAAVVAALERRAGERVAILRNVIAEQQLEMWGDNQRRELWRHEIAIYSQGQTFREIKADGTLAKVVSDLPYPKAGARPGSEWSMLLRRVAAGAMPLRYLGTSSYQGKTVHTFSYAATAQDKVCDFAERVSRTLGGSESWTGYVDCSGGVIADEQFNPLQISQELYPPPGRLAGLIRVSVAYRFIVIPGSSDPLLLPADLNLACEFTSGEWHFASVTWKNYHRFKVESTITLGSLAPTDIKP
jgi:S1-C subfamily serine protease